MLIICLPSFLFFSFIIFFLVACVVFAQDTAVLGGIFYFDCLIRFIISVFFVTFVGLGFLAC